MLSLNFWKMLQTIKVFPFNFPTASLLGHICKCLFRLAAPILGYKIQFFAQIKWLSSFFCYNQKTAVNPITTFYYFFSIESLWVKKRSCDSEGICVSETGILYSGRPCDDCDIPQRSSAMTTLFLRDLIGLVFHVNHWLIFLFFLFQQAYRTQAGAVAAAAAAAAQGQPQLALLQQHQQQLFAQQIAGKAHTIVLSQLANT